MGNHEFLQHTPEAKHAVLRANLLQQAAGEQHDPHFDRINIGELSDRDLDMYDMLLRGELTEQALSEYTQEVLGPNSRERGGVFPPPKDEFIAYLRNKLHSSIAEGRLHREH